MNCVIGGIRVDFVPLSSALEMFQAWMNSDTQRYATTPNPEMIMAAQRDAEFAAILNQADLAIADGAGLVWAARMLYGTAQSYPRLAGVDLMEAVCAQAAQKGWRIFLLGGERKSTTGCSEVLEKRYPGLKICGSNSESFTSESSDAIMAAVQASGPVDILSVAYGAPRQEKWIAGNLPLLPQVKIAMGVGGSFDYLSGRQLRAPKLLRRAGLEWLFRLVRQPWRLRRMLALPQFVVMVLKEKRKKSRIGKLSPKDLPK